MWDNEQTKTETIGTNPRQHCRLSSSMNRRALITMLALCLTGLTLCAAPRRQIQAAIAQERACQPRPLTPAEQVAAMHLEEERLKIAAEERKRAEAIGQKKVQENKAYAAQAEAEYRAQKARGTAGITNSIPKTPTSATFRAPMSPVMKFRLEKAEAGNRKYQVMCAEAFADGTDGFPNDAKLSHYWYERAKTNSISQ
jgi:uncharacterized iron-regulated membrane protein